MENAGFYGGQSARDGKVHRLSNAGSFKDLLDNVIRKPAIMGFTRKEFRSWPDAEKNLRKDGRHIVACSFPFEKGERKDEHATAVTCVIIDLDEGDFAKRLFESPAAIREHLHPYNHAVWTTAKHTVDHPRLKILVEVKPCPVRHFKRLVHHVLDKLGAPPDFAGRKESLVLSQPQYLPIAFKEEEFSAILVTESRWRALTVEDLPEEEEEEFRYAPDQPEDESILSLLSLPVPDLTPEDLREPLFSLDPDLGYHEWTEVCRALRHQFTEEEQAREAFELFDEWSATGSKYGGTEATYRKWKSFVAYPKGRHPITIRTFFKHAQELGGWSCTKLAGRITQTLLQWIQSADDADELMREGERKIAASPFNSPVVEEGLILAWRKRLKELTGSTLSMQALRQGIRNQRKRDRADKLEESSLPPWLQTVTYIAADNVFHDSASGVSLSPVSFDNKFSQHLMPKDGAETPPNGRPLMTPSAYALNLMDLQRVDMALYNPQENGEKRVFTWNNRSYLNLYNPNTVPAADPDLADRAEPLWWKLLEPLIAEPKYRRLFTDYIAFCVQNPGVVIQHAWVIQSVQGTGKGTMARTMKGVFGQANVATISPEVIAYTWNDWMIGKQLYILEEMHLVGEYRKRTMTTLKPWVTDPVLSIHKRNQSAFEAPNFANQIAFTNHRDAIALEPGDRRWVVIFSPLQSRAQVLELNASGHFDEVQWLTTPEGGQGLRYFLQTWKISEDFKPFGPAPRTEYADMVVEMSKPELQVRIERMIASGELPRVNENYISLEELTMRMGPRDNHQRVVAALRELGYERSRVVIDGGDLWTKGGEEMYPDIEEFEV